MHEESVAELAGKVEAARFAADSPGGGGGLDGGSSASLEAEAKAAAAAVGSSGSGGRSLGGARGASGIEGRHPVPCLAKRKGPGLPHRSSRSLINGRSSPSPSLGSPRSPRLLLPLSRHRFSFFPRGGRERPEPGRHRLLLPPAGEQEPVRVDQRALHRAPACGRGGVSVPRGDGGV